MQEEIEQKTLTLIINSSKLTGRVVAKGFAKVLRYAHNKVKDHRSAKPQGKQSVKKLIAQNQGVETAEIADKDEAKKFDRIARKYGVDYAIRKGINDKGETRYILFFKAKDQSAISQAMNDYTKQWAEQSKGQQPSFRKTLQELMDKLPGKAKAKDKEIVR